MFKNQVFKNRILLLLTTIALAIVTCTQAVAEPLVVRYPLIGGEASRSSYPLALLTLALDKSNVPYELKAVEGVEMTQARAMTTLEQGKLLDVIWIGTSMESESRFLPVRIPVFRGLLGHRIFLINKSKQQDFSKVQNLEDLKKYTAGQGIGWSDIEILDHAGIKVVTFPYENLFKMVSTGRFDFFPRGISEAFAELDAHAKELPGLAVEQDLVLIYKFAMFFFVNKNNKALHDIIYQGLLTAYNDGSFMQLFNTHPQVANAIKKSNLKKRRKIYIPNHSLTEETKAIPAQFWHDSNVS